MRAFDEVQQMSFLNAFGEKIQLPNGDTFKAIIEVVPFSIDSGSSSFIEGEETYLSMKKDELLKYNIVVDSIVLVRGIEYSVYNIIDDLSAIVNVYYRTTEAQHFAEDY
ncbi:hypothetical protein GKQ23_13060 [Erwinia sp. E602]|uniref:hypothetical protein n=1 Tax=Erwinia sp. E602 TaxID=2675378 RepID=UPI001BAC9CE9|nr:hypothetical protein [Erwinia sp. E602]QUG75864.1 hypothetical protein GKQ23_13060 [Erwinia sp. E602]